MRESDIKRLLVKEMRMEGGYARRIEDKFAVGMPDLVMIPPDCPVIWLEMKVLTGTILRVTARQLEELWRLRRPPHSISFMGGWKDGGMYISPPKEGITLSRCFHRKEQEGICDFLKQAVRAEKEYASRY